MGELKTVVSKVHSILKTEGLRSLVNRSVRYVRYRVERARSEKGPTLKEWADLKGLYSGRRAFLLGNGPSLNETELYLLKDEHTMCFNRFDLMLERLNWVPTFYSTIDDRVLLDTVDVVNKMSSVSERSFFPDIHPFFVDFRSLIEKRSNVHWLFLDRTDFSDQLPYCGINKTVANVGLQILGYLGFSEIYLLGVDMSYSVPKRAIIENARDITAMDDDDESHFDPRYFGKGRKFHVPMLDETFAKFEEAKRFFETRGVRIVNSSVGGKLDVFPRIPLLDVLGVSSGTQKEVFLDLLRRRLSNPPGDLSEWLEGAVQYTETEQASADVAIFRISQEKVHRFVLRWIHDFVPFGPYDACHWFVNRDLLKPTEP